MLTRQVLLCNVLFQAASARLIYNSTARPTSCKYHMYNPHLFDMYSNCINRNKYWQNDQDTFFVATLLDMNASVSPSEADIFIVPVEMTLSISDHCASSHANNTKQMWGVLESIKLLNPTKRNHFISTVSKPNSIAFFFNTLKLECLDELQFRSSAVFYFRAV